MDVKDATVLKEIIAPALKEAVKYLQEKTTNLDQETNSVENEVNY